MSSKSDCSGIGPTIIKLRALREKLCNDQREWKNAFDVRDFIVSELTCLSSMIENEEIPRDKCLERSREILNYFSDNQEKSEI